MTGASQMMCGRYAEAAETLTLSLEEKNDPDVRYLRGSALLAEERFEEALKDFTAAERDGADRERCRYSSGVCRMQLGRTNEAIGDFTWVAKNGKDETLREEAARQIELLRNGSEKKP
jgi:tetratricopeptide (TPR) repeat protein